MTLLDQLEEAEATAERIRRQIRAATCQEVGHDWVSIGGCNAGCSRDCNCSIPVLACKKCGDCDYGENEEANETKANCAKGDGHE